MLTKLERSFAATDMDQDLIIEADEIQHEFRQVIYSGLPATAMLLAAVGIGVRVLARRRRDT